jgi:predicted nucleic acid-binding protein
VKICLDTNVFPKLARHYLPLTDLIDESEIVYIPVIVTGELFAGFRMGDRFEQNRQEFNSFVSLSGVQEIQINHTIADRYGILVNNLKKNGKPIPTNDIWIAAVALETGSHLVTYDNHFDNIDGLIILSP